MPNPTRLLEMRFPALSEQLQPVRQRLREALDGAGCGRAFIDTSVLAVDEAIANIIRHAYREQPAGDVVLELLATEDRLIFRLTDFAPPVDLKTLRPRALEEVRPGGLGVHLIRRIMDHVELRPGKERGNCLEMIRTGCRN